ncbi:MAG: LPS export ABC transporter periplasmic protein LptC [Myxococcota bacterium]
MGAATLACNSNLDALEIGVVRPVVEMPPIEMEGVRFEGYHGDLRDVSVIASSAIVDMKSNFADLREVSISFASDDEGAGKISIAAPVGEFHLDVDDFKLSKGVTGETEEGQRFTTDTARYIGSRRVIVSDVPVELRRDNLVVSAAGMEMEVATHRLRLNGNVRARVKPK